MISAADIRDLRTARNENPIEFAAHFGVARSTIYHWEKWGPPTTGPGKRLVEQVVAALKGGCDAVDGGDGCDGEGTGGGGA